MNITVRDKRIDTEPMRNLLVQGESLVDRIIIKLPKIYGDVDMAQLEYSINATNDLAEITVTEVLTKTVTETAIEVAWLIKSPFTATAGELKLMLSGTDEAGEVIYQAYGEPIFVRKNPNAQGFASIQETLYEQLLAQINYQIAHMQVIRIRGTHETLSALNAAVTEPLIGDMYNVGDTVPYTVYVWQGEWVSLGALQGPQGIPGADGQDGANGTNGTDGIGLPAGGTAGQIPAKQSASNYDIAWKTLAAGDVGAVAVAAKTYTTAEKTQIRSNISAPYVASGAWMPTITAQSGTITTSSVIHAFYEIVGKFCRVIITILVTTKGTGAGALNFTLPIAAANATAILVGRETAVSGKMLQGVVQPNSTTVFCLNYDNTDPLVNGGTYTLAGLYEIV